MRNTIISAASLLTSFLIACVPILGAVLYYRAGYRDGQRHASRNDELVGAIRALTLAMPHRAPTYEADQIDTNTAHIRGGFPFISSLN